MITVAILSVIVAIAIPAYNGYITEARLSTARSNMDSLRLFLEDHRLDNGTYVGDSGASNTLISPDIKTISWLGLPMVKTMPTHTHYLYLQTPIVLPFKLMIPGFAVRIVCQNAATRPSRNNQCQTACP